MGTTLAAGGGINLFITRPYGRPPKHFGDLFVTSLDLSRRNVGLEFHSELAFQAVSLHEGAPWSFSRPKYGAWVKAENFRSEGGEEVAYFYLNLPSYILARRVRCFDRYSPSENHVYRA